VCAYSPPCACVQHLKYTGKREERRGRQREKGEKAEKERGSEKERNERSKKEGILPPREA
jgi:hypothetical protein